MAYGLRNKEFEKKKKANLLTFLLASIVIPIGENTKKIAKSNTEKIGYLSYFI